MLTAHQFIGFTDDRLVVFHNPSLPAFLHQRLEADDTLHTAHAISVLCMAVVLSDMIAICQEAGLDEPVYLEQVCNAQEA